MRGSYCIQCIEVTSTGTRSGQIKVTVQCQARCVWLKWGSFGRFYKERGAEILWKIRLSIILWEPFKCSIPSRTAAGYTVYRILIANTQTALSARSISVYSTFNVYYACNRCLLQDQSRKALEEFSKPGTYKIVFATIHLLSEPNEVL